MRDGQWGLVQTSAPAVEPVSVDQARAWLRVDGTAEDPTIIMLISAARRFIERRTNRALITSGWTFTLDRFPLPQWAADRTYCMPPAIQLPRGPVKAVNAVKYVDTAGVQQTMTAGTDYTVDLTREPVRIAPAWSKAWPTARNQQAAISVEFTAGYDTPADVPEDLTLALRLLIGHWFEHRENVTVGAISSTLAFAFDELVEPYRLWSFM